MIVSSYYHLKWSSGSLLLLVMPLGPMKHCFPQLLCWGNLQRGSRKLGLVKSGIQNIQVISHILVEDYLQFNVVLLIERSNGRASNELLKQPCLLFCEVSMQNGGVLKDTVGKIRPYSPATLNVKWKPFASWGWIALATVSTTQKRKQNFSLRTLTWEITKVSVQQAFSAFVCGTPIWHNWL